VAVVSNVEARYTADTTAYVRSLQKATDATNQFAQQLPNAENSQDKVRASTIALGSAMGMLGAQVFAKATGAVMKYAHQGIAAAKQYEQTVISIQGIFVGTGMSMEKAADKTEKYLGELRDFAARTPFELPQTLDAVKRLLSIGYAADDVKDRMLPAIGDIVAALGQPASAINGVVYAMSQMKSAGRVLSQDLMQIGTALPGFNAKMTLAKELFAGDMQALTKAMDKGAVNSDKAIDALILGMTKFGGAAGAMDRQSKTLAGTMSTFSDTVNNALIDGLLPSLPVLSATLNEVMPAVEAMATAFAQALGPALIDGASLMGKFSPSISAVVPPLLNLVSQLTVVGDIVMAMAPLIQGMANALGLLATIFGQLPAPIYAAIGGLLLARVVMKKLQVDSATAATGISAAFLRIKMAVIGGTDTIRLSVMLAGVSFKAFALSARQMAATFMATMKAIGLAAKGLMASLGPVGWAIMAVSVAFEVFSGKSAQAEELVGNLKSTVDETTNAFTALTAAAMGKAFRLDIDPEGQAKLAAMGVGIDQWTAAIMKGGDAAVEMHDKLQYLIDTASAGDWVNGQRDMLITAQRNFDGMADAAEGTRYALEAEAQATEAAAKISAQTAYDSFEVRRALEQKEMQSRATALGQMTEDEKNHLRLYEEKNEAYARASQTAKVAINGLTEATQQMLDVMSNEASYDDAREGILKLSQELDEGKKTIKGYSQAALDNRSAIRDAAQGYIDYANSLSDPVERQNALEEGARRVTKALKKAGIDPSESKILKTMKEEATQSKLTVDEFAKQRDIAETYGNEVGKNFIDGIVKQLETGQDDVNVAATAVGAAMPDAANKGQDAASPSRKAMDVAKNFIDGIVAGIRRDKKIAEREVSDLGESMLSALQDKLDEFSQKMQTAGEGLSTMGDLTFGTKGKFGLPSEIQETFGAGASIGGVLGQYEQLSASIKDVFAPFLDESILPKSVVRSNRKAMDDAMKQLDELTANAIRLLKRREQIQKEMQDLDASYSKTTEGINSKYDALDKTATENVKKIEAHYAQLIPKLEKAYNAANDAFERENSVLGELIGERNRFLGSISDGFRKFANNLRVDGSAVTKTITTTTRQMIGGISVLTEESSNVSAGGGGGFRQALEDRLISIRNFSANVQGLLRRGLDSSLVQEFVSAGVDSAGEMVANLMAGSDSDLAAINATQQELSAAISEFQTSASAQWFDAGIAQQQAIVAPLQASAAQAALALQQSQAARDSELAAAQAHQEQLRVDRAAALEVARLAYEKQRDDLIAQSAAINTELNTNATNIEAVFTALRASLKAKMIPTGRAVINGILAGLREREGALYDKARAIADRVRAEISSALQIASPSKVTEQMGRQIAQGLIQGMEGSMGSVADAANGLARAANPGLPAGQYNMNTGTGSTGRSVVISEGAVQISFGGSMDDRSAGEIQAIVDESLMRLAREIRRS
jgi:hypothetical protein